MYWPILSLLRIQLPLPRDNDDGFYRTRIVRLRPFWQLNKFFLLTETSVYLFNSESLCPVGLLERSPRDIEEFGKNVDICLSSDGLACVVTTSEKRLIFLALSTSQDGGYEPNFPLLSPSQSKPGPFILPSCGSTTIYPVKFSHLCSITPPHGYQAITSLDNSNFLLISDDSTKSWLVSSFPSNSSQHVDFVPIHFTSKDFIDTDDPVSLVFFERTIEMLGIVTKEGKACLVTLKKEGKRKNAANSIPSVTGYCFHDPSTKNHKPSTQMSINPRFSLAAIGCTDGSIVLYHIYDYQGTVKQFRIIEPPVITKGTGSVLSLQWSPDGYGLFAGYEHGWAVFSVYGRATGDSFYLDALQKPTHADSWATNGASHALWTTNLDEILIISEKTSSLHSLRLARWAVSGCLTADNIANPTLVLRDSLLIYQGKNLSDLTTINHDALLWQTVSIPLIYRIDNFPIRTVSISSDGRYVAIAGKRGLAHYSVWSGRWKLFVSEVMEQKFIVVRGCLLWYGHVLIAAVDDIDTGNHEIRLYSREMELDDAYVLYSLPLPNPIITISLVGDTLLVYTYGNVLFQFFIFSSGTMMKLVMVNEISFANVVHTPTRVRSISWALPPDQAKDGDPSSDVSTATIIVLTDGKLVCLVPGKTVNGELKYSKRTLNNHVEYFYLTPSGSLKHSLWAYDGEDVLVWFDLTTSYGITTLQYDHSPKLQYARTPNPSFGTEQLTRQISHLGLNSAEFKSGDRDQEDSIREEENDDDDNNAEDDDDESPSHVRFGKQPATSSKSTTTATSSSNDGGAHSLLDHFILPAINTPGTPLVGQSIGNNGNKKLPMRIPVIDFYPISFLIQKGLIIGLETEIVQLWPGAAIASSSLEQHNNNNQENSQGMEFRLLLKQSTRYQLFVDSVLYHFLSNPYTYSRVESIGEDYRHLQYFDHLLEMLLHRAIDEVANAGKDCELINSSTRALTKTFEYIKTCPNYLQVVVSCARKTEAELWTILFSITGSPKKLFNQCMKTGKFDSASGYLLVLQTINGFDSSLPQLIELYSCAIDNNEWIICKHLARFLVALDPSLKRLNLVISHIPSLSNLLSSQ